MTDSSKFNEMLASFAEWRGTVTSALDFIKSSLSRLEQEDQEQWETIENIRGSMEKHRDRCDQVSRDKAAKSDLDTIREDVGKKASATDVADLKKEVGNQGKSQIKQGVTMTFYGLIGGALFTLLMALFNYILSSVRTQ
jgi:hypothetical protein